MAPLPNIGNKVIAGAGSIGKTIGDSVKDAVTTTAKAGLSGIVGPELFALKAAVGSGLGNLSSTLSKNYNELLNATNDNNASLDSISDSAKKSSSSMNKLETLTQTGVITYLKKIADNTSYLAELKEDLAVNQARDTLEMSNKPILEAANDNNPQNNMDKKGMSPLLLAGLIIGGVSAFVKEFLAGLKAGTLKWIKAIGKITGISLLLENFSKAIKLDNIKTNIKSFYQNISNNVGRFKTMSVEAFKNARVTAAERLASLRTTIVNAFSKEGAIGKILTRITAVPKMLNSVFQNPFDDLVLGIKNVFTRIKTYTTDLVKGFSFKTITEPLSKAFGFITKNPIVETMGKLGKALGKFFYPIGLAISIFDGLKEAKEEYDNAEGADKYFKGFQGGVRGFLKSFIGIPLDLLKSILSWALGKFGFKKAEEFLDNFKFEEIIGSAIDTLFDGIRNTVNGVIELIADIVGVFNKDGANKIRSFKMKTGQQRKDEEAAKKAGVEFIDNDMGGATKDTAMYSKYGANSLDALASKSMGTNRAGGVKGKFTELVKAGTKENRDVMMMVDDIGSAAKSINKIASRVPDVIGSGGGIVQNNVNSGGSNNNNKNTTIQYTGGGRGSERPWEIKTA